MDALRRALLPILAAATFAVAGWFPSPAVAYTPDLDFVGLFVARGNEGGLVLSQSPSDGDDRIDLVPHDCRAFPSPTPPTPVPTWPPSPNEIAPCVPTCLPDAALEPAAACPPISLGRLESPSAYDIQREMALTLWLSTDALRPTLLRSLAVELVRNPDRSPSVLARLAYGSTDDLAPGGPMTLAPRDDATGEPILQPGTSPTRLALGTRLPGVAFVRPDDILELRIVDLAWERAPDDLAAGLFLHFGGATPSGLSYRVQWAGWGLLSPTIGYRTLGAYLDELQDNMTVRLRPPTDVDPDVRFATNDPPATACDAPTALTQFVWSSAVLDESIEAKGDGLALLFLRVHYEGPAANASVRIGLNLEFVVGSDVYPACSPLTLLPAAATAAAAPLPVVFPVPLRGAHLPAGSQLVIRVGILAPPGPEGFEVLFGSIDYPSAVLVPADLWPEGPASLPIIEEDALAEAVASELPLPTTPAPTSLPTTTTPAVQAPVPTTAAPVPVQNSEASKAGRALAEPESVQVQKHYPAPQKVPGPGAAAALLVLALPFFLRRRPL